MKKLTTKQEVNLACCSIAEKYGLMMAYYKDNVYYRVYFQYENSPSYHVLSVCLVDDMVVVNSKKKTILSSHMDKDYYFTQLDMIVKQCLPKKQLILN